MSRYSNSYSGSDVAIGCLVCFLGLAAFIGIIAIWGLLSPDNPRGTPTSPTPEPIFTVLPPHTPESIFTTVPPHTPVPTFTAVPPHTPVSTLAPSRCVIKGNVSFDTGERIYHVP